MARLPTNLIFTASCRLIDLSRKFSQQCGAQFGATPHHPRQGVHPNTDIWLAKRGQVLIGVDSLGEHSKLRCMRDFVEEIYRFATRCNSDVHKISNMVNIVSCDFRHRSTAPTTVYKDLLPAQPSESHTTPPWVLFPLVNSFVLCKTGSVSWLQHVSDSDS